MYSTWHPDVNSQCGKKDRHRRYVDALLQADKGQVKNGNGRHYQVRPYKCPHCGFFHVGKAPRYSRRLLPYNRLKAKRGEFQ